MFAAFVVEDPILADFLRTSATFVPWLIGFGIFWFVTVVMLTVLALVASLLYSFVHHRSLLVALRSCLMGLRDGVRDCVMLPFGTRRILAIAKLSFKEAIRRRILYVFVMFLLPLLFAGWYLRAAIGEEGRLVYVIAFVTNVIGWLVLPLVVFVTSMSLPTDLKTQTLHTVVTKPVRRLEIVVGRIAGFMAIFTIVLAVMVVVCLAYVAGEMSQVSERVYNEQWTARVPIFASQAAAPPITDGQGRTFHYPLIFEKPNASGMTEAGPGGRNVGKEWQYRSHIEGATSEAATWYFAFDPNVFDGKSPVRVEMTFDIFKTTKGDPTREDSEKSGVWCLMQFHNGETGQRVHDAIFRVNNHRATTLPEVPAEVFKSGLVVVRAQCLTPTQFLGMAPHDLYFLARQKSFTANFFKGALSVWLQVLLLTSVAVAASTVLNGHVTILFTAMIFVVGFYHSFLDQLVRGEVKGGGPVESFFRLVTQDAQITLLPDTILSKIIVAVDQVLLRLLQALSFVVPNLTSLDTTQFVAEGYDIPLAWLARNVFMILGYVVPVIVAGYFCLKNREIAL